MPSKTQPMKMPSLVLRVCLYCNKSAGRGVQLKRCSGCASVVYCSKQCQKAAWPKHKELCMLSANYTYNWGSERHALTGSRYGYEDFIELRQALRDFIEANYWAFHMLSKALAVLEDGFTSGAQTPSKILNITRRLAQDSRMLNYRWMSLDEFKSNAKEYEQWQQAAPIRVATAERHASHLQFKGILSIVFDVFLIITSMTYFYPQFYPCIPMPLPQSDEEIAILRSIIEDTITLAKASTNADMALRCTPDDNLWELPLPGRFVQRNKTWVWEPSFSDWAAFLRGGHTCREVDLLKDAIARLKSGFPIPVFLAIVQRGPE